MSALKNKQLVKLNLHFGGSKWQWEIAFGTQIFFVSHIKSQNLMWTDVISLLAPWRKPDGFHFMQKYKKTKQNINLFRGSISRLCALTLCISDWCRCQKPLSWPRLTEYPSLGRRFVEETPTSQLFWPLLWGNKAACAWCDRLARHLDTSK